VHSLPPRTQDTRPFLKWTGGKRWLSSEINDILLASRKRYYEPFLGGGAVFFSLRAWPATLSDINGDLITTYVQVRDNVDAVISRLQRLEIDRATFSRLRAMRPRSPVTQAVRMLYLNRTAFNGMYRVNSRGEFNVPFGCKEGTILCDEQLLRAASRALQNRTLVETDFEKVIDSAGAGDLVYADPPYTTCHDNNGFRRYNESLFLWADQERLAKACKRAVRRGASVVVSNAAHREIALLYSAFTVRRVFRYTSISASAEGRGIVSEVVYYKTPV